MGGSGQRGEHVAVGRPSPSISEGEKTTKRKRWEFAVGIVTLIAHFWFLWFLQQEYQSIYAPPYTDSTTTTTTTTNNASNSMFVVPEYNPTTAARDYVALWTPVFVISIFVEAFYSYWNGLNLYSVNDTLGSMGAGMFMIVGRGVLSFLFLRISPYAWVYENFGLTHGNDWFNGVIAWWVMFVGVDFAYFFVHKHGHEINFFWAQHGVHHSSEYYNLSTALRQSLLHGMFSFVYYLPLALFFPPPLFYLHSQFNLLYQFWIHTQCVGKLGWLEYVLNTPSQHRVHHGRNEYCIDANFGGTLCVFDRLFGTFVEERDEVPVVYGLTHALGTFEPIAINWVPWAGIFSNVSAMKTIQHKIRCFWWGPGWVAGTENEQWGIPPCTRETIQVYDPIMPTSVSLYILVQFTIAIVIQGAALQSMANLEKLGFPVEAAFMFNCSAVACFMVMGCLVSIGMISDRRPYAPLVETVRLAASSAFALYVISHTTTATNWWLSIPAIAVYVACALSQIALFIGWSAIVRPLSETEIGKDLPNTAEAEKKELANYARRNKTVKSKTQ